MNFFDKIIDFFSFISDIIVNLVSSITNLLIIVGSSLSLPLSLVLFVPGIIGASISLVCGVGVAKLLLGWGNI